MGRLGGARYLAPQRGRVGPDQGRVDVRFRRDADVHGDDLARVLAARGDHAPHLCRVRAHREVGGHGHPVNLARRPVYAGGYVDGEYRSPGGVHLLDDPGLLLPHLPREARPEQGVDDEVGRPKLRVEVFLGR